MSAFTDQLARMFPVDPADIAAAIEKLRIIREDCPAVITRKDAACILNALVRYEASVQFAATSVTESADAG